MIDRVTQRFTRSLEHTLKRKVTKDEVRWWFEEQSRYLTYGSQFLSFNSKENVGKKVLLLTLELPPNVKDYSWVNYEVL